VSSKPSVLPTGLSFDEAASLFFGATTALHFLRKAHVRRGDKVLVVGASGTVGVAIVQLAKQFGAEVTAVTSTGNCGLVTALGADEVVDYTREDFTGRSERYDIIADTVGTPFSRCKKALGESGRMLAIVAGLPDMLASLWVPLTSRRKIIAGPAGELPEDVRHILDLAAAGKLKPVIDKRYTFSQMAEAHAYVATGRKRGSVVVSVDP
jgi:NADPH:quinone reductase-like Zn-dependent oxidoreductase